MKCKPGDAVVVVGPAVLGDVSAIGSFGTVVQWVERFEELPRWDRMAADSGWLVQLARPVPGPFPTGVPLDIGVYPDRSLMPIRPGAEDEDTSEGQDARIGEVAHG